MPQPTEQQNQDKAEQQDYLSQYKINFTPEQGKNIAQIFCKEIKTALSDNDKIYKRANRNMNLYNQVTKYQSSGKVPNTPWYGAADYFAPLVEWIVDAVWGRVLKVLFYKRPYMKAKGVEASDVEREDGVTDFVDQIHAEQIHLYDHFKFYVKQMIILPMAVMKYCWHTKYHSQYEKERTITFRSPDGIAEESVMEDEEEKANMLMQSGFILVEEGESIVLHKKKIYDGTKLQYIKACDYVWSSSAKKGMLPYFEGDRFYQTIAELQQNDDYDKEAVKKLKLSLSIDGLSAGDAALKSRQHLFECFHIYGKLPIGKNLEVDFSDPEAIEQEIHAIVSIKEEELLMLNRWEYKRIPEAEERTTKERVYLRRGFEETEGFDYRSLVDKLYMTQKELNTLHNNIMNNAMLCMMKIFYKRKTLKGETWERPQVRPGMFLEVDMPTDVGVLDVGDVKSISWELESSLINFAERISNISVYQTGTARSTGGQKTKGEVDRTVYEGNIGLDKFVEECFDAEKTLSQWTVDYYYQNMPQGLERRIRGDEGKLIFPTEENQQIFNEKGILPYWEQDNLAGKFDFEWENTSLNTSEAYAIQVANDLQDRYLPQPMIQGSMLHTWEILKRGLKARNIIDWQNYLPSREAIVQEMERMNQEAQAKEQAMAGEKNIRGNAIQKAVEMGVPQSEAVKLAGAPQV